MRWVMTFAHDSACSDTLGTKVAQYSAHASVMSDTTNMPATSAVPKQGGQEFAGSSSEIFLRHPRTLRRMICPSPARPSATARPTRRACPAPTTAAAPGAVRQQLCTSASYGDPVPGVRALLHRLQTLRGCESLGGSPSALRGRLGPCRGQKCSFAQA